MTERNTVYTKSDMTKLQLATTCNTLISEVFDKKWVFFNPFALKQTGALKQEVDWNTLHW